MKNIKDLMNLDKGDLIAGVAGLAFAGPVAPLAGPILAVGAKKAFSALLNGIQNDNEDKKAISDLEQLIYNGDPEEAIKLLDKNKDKYPKLIYHYQKGICYENIGIIKENALEESCEELGININEIETNSKLLSTKKEIASYKIKAKREFDKSLVSIKESPDLAECAKSIHFELYKLYADPSIGEEYDILNARRHAIAALGGADEEIDVNEHYSRITDYVIEQEGLFLSQPYGQRQFLYMARNDNDIAGCYDDNIYNVFTIQKYPQEFSFPAGHPQPNSLYYAHPAIPGYYIPIDTADEVLFKDKVNAFCQLAQCLGATEITFRSTKGKRIDESTITSLDIEAGGEYKGVGGSAGYNNNRKKTEKSTHDEASLMRQTYNPTILPHIPNDNSWYKVDNDWKRLTKQRMEGNMLHYSTKISSHDTMAVTGARMDGVKAAFNTFVAKGNASVNIQKETSFEREEETEWEISVEFKPFCEFETTNNKDYSLRFDIDNILHKPNSDTVVALHGQMLPWNIKAGEEICVWDKHNNLIGEFDVSSIMMFGKLLDGGECGDTDCGLVIDNINKLPINNVKYVTLKTTQETFELPSNEISASEQEYIDELKEMLAEGELTPRERRLLDKIRISLGISDERAIQLEESLQPTLTDEEQDYLNEYKAIIAEGEPTDRDLRLLSKFRKALDISEERAEEIERLAASMA